MIKSLLTLFCRYAEKSNLQLLAIALLISIFSGNLNAQVSNYNVEQTANTFSGFTGTAVIAASTTVTVDDQVENVALPFPFLFNGTSYNSINVSVNGFATFGAVAPSAGEYSPISGTGGYAGAVSLYGRDLDLIKNSTNDIQKITAVEGGINVFKIQWRIRRSTTTNSSTGTSTPDGANLTMQLCLIEGTNVIEMRYFNWTPGATLLDGQIGLRGSSNTDFKNLQYAPSPVASWPGGSGMTVGTTNNLASVQTTNTINIATTSNKLFRWTPVTCFAPTALNVTAVDITTAQLNWTNVSPAPAAGYEYYITTSSTLPTAVTTGIPVTASPQPLAGLSGGATYVVYMRSNCGGEKSSWSTGTTFTALCTAHAVPYTQDFNPASIETPYVVPAIPPCSRIQQDGTGNLWVTAVANAAEGFPSEHLEYVGSGSNNANVWFYTRGVALENGKSYRISYKYGGTSTFTFINNKMQVRYGTLPNVVAMTAGTQIADHPSIKSSPITNVVNFTTPAGPLGTTVYYFGFQAYSDLNNGTLYLDDIDVRETTCFPPTALVNGQVTTNSALVSWTAPVAAPGSGYEYFISTSATAPNTSSTPVVSVNAGVTLVNLSALTPATTYYLWVRSDCGNGDVSGWSAAPTTFTTAATTNFTGCIPTGSGAQDPNGITNVTMGTINNSTGREAGFYGDYSNLSTSVAQGATVPVLITYQTGFNYFTRIWVDWNNNNDFTDAGELVYDGISSSSNPTTLTASFAVPAGASLGAHRLRIGGADIVVPGPCRTGSYQAFEDYTIFVTTPPPALTLNAASTTTCSGVATTPAVLLTSGAASYNVFQWSPSGSVSGNAVTGWTFNPTSTTIYTLTAFSNVTLKTTTANFTVNVNQLPTPITITPVTPVSICSGTPQQLTATGGIVSGQGILVEGFNGGAIPTGWVSSNTSTGGSIAASVWRVRPDGHNTGNIWSATIHSNDNSAFAISNSDAQGSSTQTRTILTSPVIDLTGYTTASLSFWHYYRYLFGETAVVEVSTNGTAWTSLQSYNSTQGTATGFVNSVIDLTAYAAQPTVYIRWRYDATWDWGWAIDNVAVSGSSNSAVVWTPSTGLYTTATATPGSEYIAGTGAATVYAMPTSNTTYTATATSGVGCIATKNVTVNVTQISGGAVSSANQSVCGSSASPVSLSGVTGAILYWETSVNSNFAGATVVPGSAGMNTLSSAMIGIVSVQRFYRAVVNVAGCPNAYSTTHTIFADVATWNGTAWVGGTPSTTRGAIFNGNYTGASNLTACSVVVNSGAVVFNTGVTLTVQNSVTVSGGSLTFDNGASLVQINNVANTGNITYRRLTTPIRKFDYTYWGTPVSPQTLANLSPATLSDKYFYFDTTTYQWTNTPTLATSNMTPGMCYIVRAPNNYSTTVGTQYFANFIGVPNNGTYTVPVVKSSLTTNKNALSNPYPSAISANLFMQDPSNAAAFGTGTTMYFWTHNTPITNNQYSGNDFATYNFSGATASAPTVACTGCNTTAPNGTIAAGQGFMISALNIGSFTATFKNSMRLTGSNGQFYRLADQEDPIENLEKHRVWLDLTNMDGAFKQILVGYIESATNAFDNGFDGEILEAGNTTSFYSLAEDSKLTIQGRSLPFNNNDIVPIGYKSAVAGTFSIAISDKDGLFADSMVGVYLEDTLLNSIHNLNESPYVFATEAGTFDTRFVLRYTADSSLSVSSQTFTSDAVVAYKRNGSAFVETTNFEMKSVRVYDVRGRLIAAKFDINADKAELPMNIAPQVLLLQITSKDNITVTKKILF